MVTPGVMLITGTSRGIGLAMASHFVQHGYLVAGCSRGPAALVQENYVHTELEITDEKQVAAWVRGARRRFGRIDVLICNAAKVPPACLLTGTTGDMLDQVLGTNVKGTFLVCREVAKAMLLQRSGRILTLSSMAVGLHEAGTAAYAASKSAVVEMTKVLASELAPIGITCNTIAPSVFETSAVENLGEEVVAHALERLTIKRPLTTEELCHAAAFFLAPESGCITGQVLNMGLIAK